MISPTGVEKLMFVLRHRLAEVRVVVDQIPDSGLEEWTEMRVADGKDDRHLLIGRVCLVAWENKVDFHHVRCLGDGSENAQQGPQGPDKKAHGIDVRVAMLW